MDFNITIRRVAMVAIWYKKKFTLLMNVTKFVGCLFWNIQTELIWINYKLRNEILRMFRRWIGRERKNRVLSNLSSLGSFRLACIRMQYEIRQKEREKKLGKYFIYDVLIYYSMWNDPFSRNLNHFYPISNNFVEVT